MNNDEIISSKFIANSLKILFCNTSISTWYFLSPVSLGTDFKNILNGKLNPRRIQLLTISILVSRFLLWPWGEPAPTIEPPSPFGSPQRWLIFALFTRSLARCARVQQLLFSCSFNFVKLVTRFLCTHQTGGAAILEKEQQGQEQQEEVVQDGRQWSGGWLTSRAPVRWQMILLA